MNTKRRRKTKTKVTDWTHRINVREQFKKHTPEMIKLLKMFRSMRDRHLGTIRGTEDRIELKEDAKLSFQQQYCAGPMQRKLEAEETEKMIKLEVIEPSKSECSTNCVSTNKMRSLKILCRLPSFKRFHSQILVPDQKDGRMYRLTGNSKVMHDTRLQLRLLANDDQGVRPRQDRLLAP